jgi:hypothetical protein
MGDKGVWFLRADVARHGVEFKALEGYRREWVRMSGGGRMWKPPKWLEKYGEEAMMAYDE